MATAAAAPPSPQKPLFGNFDVLLEPDPETGVLELSASASSSSRKTSTPNTITGNTNRHVGNQRFQVTLNMYRDEFRKCHDAGNDTSGIVSKLVSVVTKQCVPPGRFLQKESKATNNDDSSSEAAEAKTEADDEAKETSGESGGEAEGVEKKTEKTDSTEKREAAKPGWIEVPEPLVLEFVERSLLTLITKEAKEAEVSAGNKKKGAPEKRDSRRGSFLRAPASLKSLLMMGEMSEDDSSNNEQAAAQEAESIAAAAASMEEDDTDEKKRRRRSSLLRRSLMSSEAITLSSSRRVVEERKKLNRTTEERRPSFWRVLRKFRAVSAPDQLDIVFVETRSSEAAPDDDQQQSSEPQQALILLLATEEDSCTAGNNRLRVLMQLHQENYMKGTIDKRCKMSRDWIKTVTTHWKSRFLKYDELLETYEVLDANQVETALDHVMMRQILRMDDDVNQLPVPSSLRRYRANAANRSFSAGATGGGALSALMENSENSSNSFVPGDPNSAGSSEFLTAAQQQNQAAPQQQQQTSFFPSAARRRRQGSTTSTVSNASSVSAPPPGHFQQRRSMKDYFSGAASMPQFNRGVSDSVVPTSTATMPPSISPPLLNRRQRYSTTGQVQSARGFGTDPRASFSDASASSLPEPPVMHMGRSNTAKGMQSAAVESLQRRKKRQGLASRIQKLAQKSFLRNSNSSISTDQPSTANNNSRTGGRRTSAHSISSASSMSSAAFDSSSIGDLRPQTTFNNIAAAGAYTANDRRTSVSSVSTNNSSGSNLVVAPHGALVQRGKTLHHDNAPTPPPPAAITTTTTSMEAAVPPPLERGRPDLATAPKAVANPSAAPPPPGSEATLDHLLQDALVPSPRTSLNSKKSPTERGSPS